MTDFDPIS